MTDGEPHAHHTSAISASSARLCGVTKPWPAPRGPGRLYPRGALNEQKLTGRMRATLGIRHRDGSIIEADITAAAFAGDDGASCAVFTLEPTRRRQLTWHSSALGAPVYARLTKAELRVLELLPTHYSTSHMAEILFVARNTIKTHVIAVYRKLGVSDRASAVARARALGLLASEGEGT